MCTNPQKTTDLITFTKEILNGKLHFLCNLDVLIPERILTNYLQNLYVIRGGQISF